MGELNWIFTAITDTIAWNVLPRGEAAWAGQLGPGGAASLRVRRHWPLAAGGSDGRNEFSGRKAEGDEERQEPKEVSSG